MLASITAIIFASFVLGHLTARHEHYFGQPPPEPIPEPTRRTDSKNLTPLKVKRR